MQASSIAPVRIPSAASLRSSQCIIGQGLFRQHATFDPNVEDVCVDDLVENVKACSDRLNELRHQQSDVKSQPSAPATAARTRSPRPVPPKPAWGRNTPTRAPSPAGTPRTQTKQATPKHPESDRPWRTAPHIEKETIEHEPTPEGAKRSPSRTGSQRTPKDVPQKAPPPTVAAQRAAQRVASYQKKKTAQQAPARESEHSAQPFATQEALEALTQRIVALESQLHEQNAAHDEMRRTLAQVQGENQQLLQQNQIMATDLTSKWIALSSQVQYLFAQSVSQNPIQFHHPQMVARAASYPSSSTHAVVRIPGSGEAASPAAFLCTDDEVAVGGPSPQIARRLDLSAESLPSATRLPPSPPVKLELHPRGAPSAQ